MPDPNTYTPDWRVDVEPEQGDDYDSTDTDIDDDDGSDDSTDEADIDEADDESE
jgi:hypothetical protein